MNTQEKLQAILNAGFMQVQTQMLAKTDQRKTYHDNYSTTYYFHQSVLSMHPDEQTDQPWVEHIVWTAKHLQGQPDIVEGRYGACRYPLRSLNDLHLFMRNFGYQYQLDTS